MMMSAYTQCVDYFSLHWIPSVFADIDIRIHRQMAVFLNSPACSQHTKNKQLALFDEIQQQVEQVESHHTWCPICTCDSELCKHYGAMLFCFCVCTCICTYTCLPLSACIMQSGGGEPAGG